MVWLLGAKKVSYAGKHVLITGGSTGIGLALAKEFVKRGAVVSLVARSQGKLDQAVSQLQQAAKAAGGVAGVHTWAADVTKPEQVQAALAAAEQKAGPIDVLICNAGASSPGLFLEQDIAVHQQSMQLNYFGTLNTLRAAAPGMVSRGHGQLVIVASALALIGFVGFTSYAPSKWALRGLADCLRNELVATGVSVHIAYPPDTDTPGYEAETKDKPPEAHQFSRAAGDTLYKPEQVAAALVSGLAAGAYHLPGPDVGQNLLRSALAGVTPRPHNLLLEACLAPALVAAAAYLRWLMDSTMRKSAAKRAPGGH